MNKPAVFISGAFDNLNSRQVRFIHEASRMGEVQVLLWDDESIEGMGATRGFPLAERQYLLRSIRFVHRVTTINQENFSHHLLELARPGDWLVESAEQVHPQCSQITRTSGIKHRLISSAELSGFPSPPFELESNGKLTPKVMLTGSFDWLHSGHVWFFEKAAKLGDLYVVVGHDENLRLLKGAGHPMFPQEQRLYMVAAIRSVKSALISSGHGWLDAAPEVDRIQPKYYIVNEDGNRPEKRDFCLLHGIEYVVMSRRPKPGLPRRESNQLRSQFTKNDNV